MISRSDASDDDDDDDGRRRQRRRGRPPAPDLHVLSPRARRARRRSRSRCARSPGSRPTEIARAFLVPGADDGAAPRARQAQDPQRRHPVPRPARRTCCPSARARCSPCSTCCSTRATRRRPAPSSCASTCAPRRSGSPARSSALMPDEPEALGLLALMLLHDARRARPPRRRRRPRPARGAGPRPLGRGRDRRGPRRCSTPRSGAASPARTRCRPRSPRATLRARDAARDRLGRDRRALRRARRAWCRRRSSS